MTNTAILGIQVQFEGVARAMNQLKNQVLQSEKKVFAGDKLRRQTLADAIKPSEAVQSQQALFKTGQGLGMMAKSGALANKEVKAMQSNLDGVNLNAFNRGLSTARKRFDMNTLSWLFGGMALKRVGVQMVRFMIPAQDKLAKMNTEGAKKVSAMTASLEYLKISMFETLSQTPLFAKFVEWIIKGALWLSEFAQKHPTIVAIAAIIGGLAAVLGTLAIGVSFFKQLAHMDVLLGTGLKAGKTGTGLIGKMLTLKKIIGAGLLLKAGIELYDALTNEKTHTWGQVIINSIMAGLGGALTFSPLTGLITGLTVLAVMSFDKLKDDEIKKRAGEAQANIQTIFNKTSGLDLKLNLEAFDRLFKSALDYTGSKELKSSAEQLGKEFRLDLIDEKAYRIQMANLFRTIQKSTETSPLIGLADLTAEEYGFTTFEKLWFNIMDEQFLAANANNTLMQEDFEKMAIKSGETFKTKVIDPIDAWVPLDKTITIRAKYVGFDKQLGQYSGDPDAETSSITGGSFGSGAGGDF